MYGWNYYTMKLIGIWPEERKWNQASNYLVLIPFLMIFCFICAPQTINLSLISNDFNLVIENLSMGNITITLSLLKTIAFWINGKRKYYIHIIFHELIFLQNYYIYIYNLQDIFYPPLFILYSFSSIEVSFKLYDQRLDQSYKQN